MTDKNKLTNYQERITSFIFSSVQFRKHFLLFSIMSGVSIFIFKEYTFQIFTLTLLYGLYISVKHIETLLSKGFDAVYDSTYERINMQSCWLDARLNNIETATKAGNGKAMWKLANDHELWEFYSEYPEDLERKDMSTKWQEFHNEVSDKS